MRILYIANIRLPTEKAHGVQVMKMCEAFALLGNEVELLVPMRATPIDEDPFSYYGVKRIFKVTRLYAPDTVSWGKWGFWLQTIFFVFRAANYARRSVAEVIYSRDPALFFFGRIPSDKKMVWEVHTKPTSRVIERMKKLPVFVVAITAGLRTAMVEEDFVPEKIMVAHDAVDLGLFEQMSDRQKSRQELSLPQEEKLIAYIGKYKTMGESKGVEDIISAIGTIHSSNTAAALLLVGLNKEEMPEVKELAHVSGLDQCSHLVGHVSREEVARYMKAADVLVMNYPNTEHYARFMSPLKLFEYMASGSPIVTSDLPSIREVLDETCAVFFKAGDILDLRRKIEYVLRDPVSAQKVSHVALMKVKEYTWENRAKNILESISLSPTA